MTFDGFASVYGTFQYYCVKLGSVDDLFSCILAHSSTVPTYQSHHGIGTIKQRLNEARFPGYSTPGRARVRLGGCRVARRRLRSLGRIVDEGAAAGQSEEQRVLREGLLHKGVEMLDSRQYGKSVNV